MADSLSNRVEVFKATYARPARKRLSDRDKLLQLIYDLIDDRGQMSFRLACALLGRNGGKVQ